MTVTSERRAGSSLSFVDPRLLEAAEAVRGPASTHYGSGALGGVVQLFPRRFDGWSVEGGYETQGDLSYLTLGWGGPTFSLGVAGRQAENRETPSGAELNDHYDQYSMVGQGEWRAGETEIAALLVAGAGRDLGKSNTRFPGRTTEYPREDHLLARLEVRRGEWESSVWVHPNRLETDNRRTSGEQSHVENRAFDLGGSLSWERATGSRDVVIGVDYTGRRDVGATESSNQSAEVERPLQGASQDETSVFASLRWGVGAWTLQGGARLGWHRQENLGLSDDESSANGYVGVVVAPLEGLELIASAGTGQRNPSLTERFFSGSTGRGSVVGNPDLRPERSLDVDVGARWFGGRLYFEGFVFRNRISDYIEQIDLEDDTSTFVNLRSGTIQGIELDGFYQPTAAWRIYGRGQWQRGRADDGTRLADIPANRLTFGVVLSPDRWEVDLRGQYRTAKDDPGPGEQTVSRARLLTASLRYRLAERWSFTVKGDNLLDETYRASADDLATEAAGRSFGVGVTWKP